MNFTLIVILTFTNLITEPSGEKTAIIDNQVISIQNFKTMQSCKQELNAIERTTTLTQNVEVKFKHCSRIK